MPGLDSSILADLQQTLHDVNPYCKIFNQASNILRSNSTLDLKMVITDIRSKDSRRYNTPRAAEVAVIMVGDGQEVEPLKRDIMLHSRGGRMQRISEIHRVYEPLHYVLMFPHGDNGWHPYIPINCSLPSTTVQDTVDEEEEVSTRKHVTAMNYFAYRLHLGRPGEAVVLHLFGRLFQQWIVDMYAIVEQMRLNYLKLNQKKIRSELYNGLQDALHVRDSVSGTANIGRRIILPSSFTGGGVLGTCNNSIKMEWLL